MDKFVKRKADQNLENSYDEAAKDERKRKRRKCDPEYMSFGFIAVQTSADLPLLCCVFANIIERHLTTLHSDLANKPKEYFEGQKELYFKQNSKLMACTTVNEKTLRASYLASLTYE